MKLLRIRIGIVELGALLLSVLKAGTAHAAMTSGSLVVKHASAMASVTVWALLLAASIGIGFCAYAALRQKKGSGIGYRAIGFASHLVTAVLISISIAGVVRAATTAPTTYIYNGRLLDSSSQAITTAHSIRFSYWKSVDFVSSDLTGAGAIDTSATNYAGWQEVHTVTPNSQGYFSVTLGSVSAMPSFATMSTQTMLSLYLQVEVKASADADTAYELLDVDSTDTGIDRSGVLSVPFAQNADMIDQREIGTGSGNIAILGSGGVLPTSTTPSGTNASSFTLDADNSEASSIALTFGADLEKKLTYDITNGTFRFNDDLEVQGNLTVTGLINGMNISTLQSSTGALKAFSGGGLNLNVSNGSYRLNNVLTNYAGGSIALPASSTSLVYFGSGGLSYGSSYPSDESFIPVADVTTSIGAILSILDRRALSSDSREHQRAITFSPSYDKAAYQGDGADNIGQLSVSHDNITLKNFYVWTSTKTALQDYDVILRVPVPENFVRWQADASTNPLSFQYRSTSAATTDNKLDIQVYDTAGVPVSLSGSVSNLAGTAWATTEAEFTGSPTWTAGEDMLIRLKVSAKSDFQMHLGNIKLQFVELE